MRAMLPVALVVMMVTPGCSSPDNGASFDLTWTMDYDAYRANDTRVEEWEVDPHTAGPGPLLRIENATRTSDALEIHGAIGFHPRPTWDEGPILVQAGLESGGAWNWTFLPTAGMVRGFDLRLPVHTTAEAADVVIELMQGDYGAQYDRYQIEMRPDGHTWNVTFEVDRYDCTFGPATYFLASCDGEPAGRDQD